MNVSNPNMAPIRVKIHPKENIFDLSGIGQKFNRKIIDFIMKLPLGTFLARVFKLKILNLPRIYTRGIISPRFPIDIIPRQKTRLRPSRKLQPYVPVWRKVKISRSKSNTFAYTRMGT